MRGKVLSADGIADVAAAVDAAVTAVPADAELMARLAQGDVNVLEALYRRYYRMVGSLLFRLVPTLQREEIEDLCQEVFLTLFETAPRYQEQGKLRAWICGIAAKKARSRRRHSWFRRVRLGDAQLERVGRSTEGQIEARMEMTRALETLPKHQREVLLLHVVQGLSGEETAAALGVAPNTVWTRLHRARRALSQRLRQAAETTP